MAIDHFAGRGNPAPRITRAQENEILTDGKPQFSFKIGGVSALIGAALVYWIIRHG